MECLLMLKELVMDLEVVAEEEMERHYTCTPIQDQDGLPIGQSLFDTLIPSSRGSGNVKEGQYLLKYYHI